MEEEELNQTQESITPVEKKPNFFERFWFVFVILSFILVISLGGLWAVNRGLLAPKPTPTPAPTPTPVVELDTATAALEQQETSDEISAIEADLNATDFYNIDKELTDIEAELTSP